MNRPAFGPPSIVFESRLWPAEEVAAVAAGWLDVLRAGIPRTARLTAMTLSNHPEAVALLFALSSLTLPVVVYPPDPRAWPSSPPLPEDTPLFIPPSLREMATADPATHPRLERSGLSKGSPLRDPAAALW